MIEMLKRRDHKKQATAESKHTVYDYCIRFINQA